MQKTNPFLTEPKPLSFGGGAGGHRTTIIPPGITSTPESSPTSTLAPMAVIDIDEDVNTDTNVSVNVIIDVVPDLKSKEKSKKKETIASDLKKRVRKNAKKVLSQPAKKSTKVVKDKVSPVVVAETITEAQKHIVPQDLKYVDWPFAIVTRKLRIEVSTFAYSLSSMNEYKIQEGIDMLIKIAADPIYNDQAVYQLIRGLNDERETVRDACINGLTKYCTNHPLHGMQIQSTIEAALTHIHKSEIESYLEKTKDMMIAIKRDGAMRESMIRVYHNNHPAAVNQFAGRVPELLVFYTNYMERRKKREERFAASVTK